MSRPGTLIDLEFRLRFFGISLPWLVVVLIYIAAMLFYIYLAVRRRMGSERIHPLSKLQALAAACTISVLCVGGIWKQEAYDVLEVVALYFLVFTSIFAISMATPNKAEYVKGLLRAWKQGLSHLSPWDDLALNWFFLAGVCGILLVTGTVMWKSGFGAPVALPVETARHYPLGLALAVLVVAYFGLAMQFFVLWFGKRGPMYFGLFLFLAWLLPMIAGTIFVLASMPRDMSHAGQVVYCVSPLAGIGVSAVGASEPSFTKVLQGAAIMPALFYTFIFNSLLIAARRRVHREFLARADVVGSKVGEELLATFEPAAG